MHDTMISVKYILNFERVFVSLLYDKCFSFVVN